MTEFFTSDTHFGHPTVALDRGFGDTRENVDTDAHDAVIVANWKAAIRPDDVVWVAGDLVGHNTRYRLALDILGDLPGRKRLIAGNHDVVAAMHRKAHKYQAEFLEVFESVQDFAAINIPVPGVAQGVSGVRRALISHYPYGGSDSGQTGTERYAEFRMRDCGKLLIHGHTHQPAQRVHRSDAGTTQVHIGLDAWKLKPVALRTLVRAVEDFENPIDQVAS